MCYKKMMELHLISSPGTTPWYSSIQTGCLKAYMDEKFKGLSTKTYSAHFSIILNAFHRDYENFHIDHESNHELLWFYLVLKNFYPIKGPSSDVIKKIFTQIKRHTKKKGIEKELLKLEKAAKVFVDIELKQELKQKGLNLVGFSINSEQLYSSIFCALYLKKQCPKHKIMFLFGGGQLAFPRVINVLRSFKLDGIAVIGEGELKLEHIVSTCLNNKDLSPEKLMGLCDKSLPGIYRISAISDEEAYSIRAAKEGQMPSIEGLPLPDYDDFFEVLRRYAYDESIYNALKDRVFLLLDGSRGCTHARCDFCGLNISWCKYRSKTPEKIFNSLTALIKKHGVNRVQFSDNICDHWIHKVLDMLLENKSLVRSVFELRAVHEQELFTKLYLTGCRSVQIGVEAITDELLTSMDKGTRTIDNIQILKYLEELDFECHSNLITHHIRSSLNDIKRTKDTLSFIRHFKKLNLSKFTLAESSPLYNGLSNEQIKTIGTRKKIKVPKELEKFYTDYLELKAPKKVYQGWEEFDNWYNKSYKKLKYSLNVVRIDKENSLIKRGSEDLIEEEFLLSGKKDLVYKLCHSAKTFQELLQSSGVTENELKKILGWFVNKKLMIYVSDKYLSLALRPKEDLIQDFFTARSS